MTLNCRCRVSCKVILIFVLTFSLLHIANRRLQASVSQGTYPAAGEVFEPEQTVAATAPDFYARISAADNELLARSTLGGEAVSRFHCFV